MNKRNYVFEHMIKFLVRNNLALTSLILLEMSVILIEIINSVLMLIRDVKHEEEYFKYAVYYANYVNLFYYFKRYLNYNVDTTTSQLRFYILMGLYLLLWILNNSRIFTKIPNNSKFLHQIKFVYVNLWNLVNRLFSIFIIYNTFFIFLNSLSNLITNFNFIGLLNLLLSLNFLLIFIFNSFKLFSDFCIIAQIDDSVKFPYDNFSSGLDLFYLFLKIAISVHRVLIKSTNCPPSLNKYFNFVIIFSVLFFFLKNSSQVYSNSKVIIISNLKINNLRFYLMTQLFTTIVVLLPFFLLNKHNSVISNFMAVLLSFILAKMCSDKIINKNYTNIISCHDIFYTVLHMIDNSAEGETVSKIIQDFRTYHLINCSKNEPCNFVQLEEANEAQTINTNTEYKTFLNSFKQYFSITNYQTFSTREEKYLFIISKLLYLKETAGDFPIKLIYKSKVFLSNSYTMSHFSSKDVKLSNNLKVFYNKILDSEQNKEKINAFDILSKYELIWSQLQEIIKLVIDFFRGYVYKNKKEVLLVSERVNKHRSELLNNFSILFADVKYADDFALYTYKFVFDSIFNDSVTFRRHKSYEDILELISVSYNENSILQLRLDYAESNVSFLKTNREMYSFTNQKFESMFPVELQKEAKDIFLNQLKYSSISNSTKSINSTNNLFSNKFTFDYYARRYLQDRYISIVKLECALCFSFDFNEVLILAKYEFSKDEILMTFHREGEDFLVNMSEHLGKILCLSGDKLNYFRNVSSGKKHHFLFNEAFSYNEKTNLYDFHFQKWSVYYINMILVIFQDQEEQGNRLIEDFVNNQVTGKYAFSGKSLNPLSLAMVKLAETRNNLTIYKLVDMKKRNVKIEEKGSNNSLDSGLYNRINADNISSLNNEIYSSTSSVASCFKKEERVLIFNNTYSSKSKDIYKLDKINNVRLKCLTFSLVVMSVVIVLYSVGIMIHGLVSGIHLNNVYQMKNNFETMERWYYHTTTGILNNFRLISGNTTLSEEGKHSNENADKYYDQLSLEANVTIEIPEFVNEEVSVKLDSFNSQCHSFEQSYFSSSTSPSVDHLINGEYNYFALSVVGYNYQIINNQLPLLQALKIYMGNLKTIIEGNTTWVDVHLLRFKNEKADFSYFAYNDYYPISKSQIFSYEVLINYLPMYKRINDASRGLTKFYEDQITTNFDITYMFTLVLLVLHLFLILISILLLLHFKNILQHVSLTTNEVINETSFKYMTQKLDYLSTMLQLYNEDPSLSFVKMKKFKKDYLSDERIRKSTRLKNIESKIELNTPNASQNIYYIDWKGQIKFLVILAFCIYLLFFVYSGVCYCQIVNYDTGIKTSYTYKNINNAIFKTVVNNINLIKVAILTNRTDQDFNYEISNKTDTGFMMDTNNKIISHLKSTNNMRKYAYIFQPLFDYRESITCDNLYTNTTDTIYSTLINKYKQLGVEGDITSSLINICNRYNVLLKDDISLIEETNVFYMTKLLTQLSDSYNNFSMLDNLYHSYTFYDLYNIIILIYRPYFVYVNFKIITLIEQAFFTNFSTFSIVYLCINICVDFAIMIVLYYKIVKRIRQSSQELDNFLSIFKYA